MLSITRVFRLGIRLASWATPRIKEWHRQRHLNRLEGHRHLGSRNWTEAEKHLTLALAERHHSAKKRLEVLLGLGTAQLRQGKVGEAEQTTRAAIDVAVQERDHSLHTQALDAMVDIQVAQGKHADAVQTTEEIVRLEKAYYRPDYARVAKCLRKLGTALLNSGRSTEALAAFERAAKVSEQVFGAEHAETANSLAELGKLHRQAGNHAEAQRCLRRALQIHRATSGSSSHEAAQDLYHLAASLEESGDSAGAAGEYERVLAMLEQQVGGKREEKAEAQVRLAGLYVHSGRAAAARELLTHAIGVLERTGGQVLAVALETMACADEQVGRREEAKRWRQRASEIAANQVV